jgi:3-hydroxyacyl-[acyl-carrier-protein] dehydratase
MKHDAADFATVLAASPHRYSRVLVDRMLEHEPGKHVRALKNVTVNERCFQGHFPDYPVLPGVLVIEALIQVSTILARDHGLALALAGISGARFKRQVSPGDQLLLESRMHPIVEGKGGFAVQASVGGELAAEAELLVTFAPITPGKG